MERLFQVGRWLAAAPPPRREDSDDWYAGLGVDPRGFGDQLGKLQDSLRSAGKNVPLAVSPAGKNASGTK